MKKLNFVIIFSLITLNLEAQYRELSFEKVEFPNFKIVQIDFRELSTLVHFQVTKGTSGWMCTQEDFYIQDKKTFKKYYLLNSINLPFCNKFHQLEKSDEIHNFTLEFEELPTDIGAFDIIENAESGLNFYGVQIKTSKKENDFLDVASFIDETPVKEFGHYFTSGSPVFYYRHKGVTIAVLLTHYNDSDQYYQASVLVKNLSGKDLNFNPNKITARLERKDDVLDAEVLSYEEYLRKPGRKQNWNSLAVSFSESMAANNADYSPTSSSTSGSGHSTKAGSASEYVGDAHGSIYNNSTTYGSTYSTTYSRNYDGAAAYAAKQNANKNVVNHQAQQYLIKDTLSEGYSRISNIPNETEYIGYVNVQYERNIEGLEIVIPLNGTVYTFNW